MIICVICYSPFIISFIRSDIAHHNNPYLKELKIPDGWKLYSLLDIWGEPIEVAEEEVNSNYIKYTLKFDGFSVIMNKYDYLKNKDKSPAFDCIKIWNKKYRFTTANIGVGSEKEDIMNYYKNNDSIKDLPKSKIGYIVDGYWIYFDIDDSDKIEEITITYGL